MICIVGGRSVQGIGGINAKYYRYYGRCLSGLRIDDRMGMMGVLDGDLDGGLILSFAN
jgi:hypothetical protein